MTDNGAKIIAVIAAVALVAIILSRHPYVRSDARPGIADNDEMQQNSDSLIVGDSNHGDEPVSRRTLSNVPWERCMGVYPALRTLTRQPRVASRQHHNDDGKEALRLATVAAAASTGI